MCTECTQISSKDLKAAENLLILTAQKDTYSHENNILKERLLSFRPIIKNRLISIGGRLGKSHLLTSQNT